MADTKKTQAVDGLRGQPYDDFNSDERPVADNGSTIDAQNFAFTEDRKIGVTGAVFLILNKMIGTGSKLTTTKYKSESDCQSFLHPLASLQLLDPWAYVLCYGSSAAS